jgi:hypothetical protein
MEPSGSEKRLHSGGISGTMSETIQWLPHFGSPAMRSQLFIVTLILCWFSQPVAAQLIHQTVPNQNIGSSFFENNGVQWNVNGPGFFANFGGGGAVPPFGNFDPNSGLRTGVGFAGGGLSSGLGLNFSQGSSRSIVSQSASVTTMNGMPGYISDQIVRPFVTGVTPVVGGQTFYSAMPPLPPSQEAAFRDYQHAQMAALQQRQAEHQNAIQEKAQQTFERGLRAEEDGNLRMARANYRNALRTAVGTLRLEIMARMQARGW